MADTSKKIGYEIVVFSDDWHGLPFSCKHLLKHFLPDIPLIWVETIGLRSPGFNVYDIKRAFQKILGWLNTPDREAKPLPQNLQVFDPFQIPYNHYNFIRKINKKRLVNSIRKISGDNKFRKRVMLTTWPFLGDLVGELDEQLSVYYRVDDFSEFPGVRKNKIIELENAIMDRSDLIVASAEKLAELDNKSKEVKYLPHGVDFEHFSSGSKQKTSPAIFKDMPTPRIGFFGLLNSWLDIELVYQVAKKNPQWSFVMLGPSQLPESELPSAPNLHFPGPVTYEELPGYASYFDAALVPFKINKLTIAVNPLKLMEYFALGLPVISTPLPEVVKYNKQVYIGSDVESFSKAIKKALEEDSADLRKERLKMAEFRSWKAKSQELRTWIESALEEKIDAGK